MSAPSIAKKPKLIRASGAEPPRGLNSLDKNALASAPKTNPMSSGRRYCNGAAWCNPSDPAVSRKKQAAQNPILPGLPL